MQGISLVWLFFSQVFPNINNRNDSDHASVIQIILWWCSTDMEFVQNFTPPDFQVKNFTPPISPNFNSFSKKKHKKWVKMEKFTPLAKILHCRRHWRHGQIPPLRCTMKNKYYENLHPWAGALRWSLFNCKKKDRWSQTFRLQIIRQKNVCWPSN